MVLNGRVCDNADGNQMKEISIPLSLLNLKFHMKRFFILACLFAVAAFGNAQSLSDLDKMLNKNDYAGAKAAVDNSLLDAKNAEKADYWFYKGKIYSNLSMDSSINHDQQIALKMEAFEAFKKYQSMDKKAVRMVLEEYKPYLGIYLSLFDVGAAQFNAKNYKGALTGFEDALILQKYITDNKITFTQVVLPALDTSLVLNAAISATQANETATANKYYKMLTDANVGGDNYENIYQILADQYAKEKNKAELDAIVAKARALYPTSEYWDDIELRYIGNSGDKTNLFAKYDELLKANPQSFNLNYNYAVEYYNSIYGKDERPKDVEAAKAKLTEILKNTIAADKGIDGTALMTNHLYNIAADISAEATAIKGTKPEDVKKRAELKAKSLKAMDEVIPYADKVIAYYNAMPDLKSGDKAKRSITAGYLADIYELKGDAKKAAEYAKIRDAY